MPFLPAIYSNCSLTRYLKNNPQYKFHPQPIHFLESIIGFRLANVKKNKKIIYIFLFFFWEKNF